MRKRSNYIVFFIFVWVCLCSLRSDQNTILIEAKRSCFSNFSKIHYRWSLIVIITPLAAQNSMTKDPWITTLPPTCVHSAPCGGLLQGQRIRYGLKAVARIIFGASLHFGDFFCILMDAPVKGGGPPIFSSYQLESVVIEFRILTLSASSHGGYVSCGDSTWSWCRWQLGCIASFLRSPPTEAAPECTEEKRINAISLTFAPWLWWLSWRQWMMMKQDEVR